MAQVNAQGKVQFHLKEGALHKEIGAKAGTKIPLSKLEHEKATAKKTGNTKLEERVQFAINARSFHHTH